MALSSIRAELSGFDWHDLKNTETIGSWPLTVRVAALLLAFVLCFALGYQGVIGSRRAAQEVLMSERAALRQELAQKAVLAADLAAQRALTLSHEQALARLLQQFPGKKQLPQLVDWVTAVGHDNRLRLTWVGLDAERAQEFFSEQPVRMEMVGRYHDFAAFFSGVANLPRLVTVHDFSIARRQDGLLAMTVTLLAYRQQGGEEGSADNAAKALPRLHYQGASLRSPFDELDTDVAVEAPADLAGAPDPTRATEPLERFALPALHMVGVMARGTDIQALVRDGRGLLHRVAVGQHMGQDYGRVQHIAATQIELVERVQSASGWQQRPRTLLLQRPCLPGCEGSEVSER